jgi:3',5'-cyclic AMP phosphodiesterase CpdA
VHAVPGNHDDPERLRAHFDSSADSVADLGPLRLVLLDTTAPGQDTGDLTAGQIAWLDRTLSADRAKPTLLALHHPPLPTGMPSADAMGIVENARRALGGVLAQHPQVRRIVAGHVHRAIAGEFASRSVLTVPSTFAQLNLDFHTPGIQVVPEPPGFVVHALVGDDVVSHIQPVT